MNNFMMMNLEISREAMANHPSPSGRRRPPGRMRIAGFAETPWLAIFANHAHPEIP